MNIVWNDKKKDYFAILFSMFVASFFSNYSLCLIIGLITYIGVRYIQVTFSNQEDIRYE